MPFEANVIRLNVAQPAQQAASERPRLALARVRNEIAGHLRQVLQALFESADDWLFEIADHSADRNEQHALFEAMRDLRLNRTVIERSFQQRVFEAFAGIGPDEAAPPVLRRLFATPPLHTERPRDPRESVALAEMATRLGPVAAAPLGQLTQRIGALIGRTITQPRNPFGPGALCGYFLDACQALGVDLRVRLVLLRLFERYVGADLDRLYRQSNRTLAAAGVLPTLQVVAEHEPGSLQPVLPASPEHPTCGVFDGLRTLWLRRERRRRQQRGGPLRIGREAIANPHDTAHALVAMLFDALTRDHTLPAALRTLLPRMLPAFTRTAALDQTLFEQHGHPARRLLDEMVDATIGWNDHDDLQADPTFRAIEQITLRLAGNPDAHGLLFRESLSCLRAVCTEERRRSDLLMQRTLGAEQQRQRTAAARKAVETALDARLFGKLLPAAVVHLLCEGWSKVLLQTHLRHGVHSAQWRSALQTVDQLLWSLTFTEPRQSRARLLQLLPELLEDLRKGLAAVAFDPFATAAFFAQLERIHLHAAAPDSAAEPAARRCLVNQRVRLAPSPASVAITDDTPLPPALLDRLRPGCWVELHEENAQRLRCRLAAPVPTDGHYLFVNRSGLRVLERSASMLASDWQHCTLRLLEDGSAFERALAVVVAGLQRGAAAVNT